MSQEFTDRQIIEAICFGGNAREGAWRHIAEQWGGYCCATAIKKTNCDESEARQAFSLACVGVDRRIRSAASLDLLQTASLKTYLTSATTRAAWAIVVQRKKDSSLERPEEISSQQEEAVADFFQLKECRETLEQALSNVGPRCKKLLLLFNDDFGMKEIMAVMSFKSEDVAKTEKWQCQEKFKSYLRTHPQIKNLLKENCYG